MTMPNYDVFITARLRVEAADELKAEGMVLDALDERLGDFLADPRVQETAYTLSSESTGATFMRRSANHRNHRRTGR